MSANKIDTLEKLVALKEKGILTEEEFQREKELALTEDSASRPLLDTNDKKFGMSDETYNVVLHLSQYCSFVVPYLGIVAPIGLWMMNKDDDPIVDEHGRNVINWNISLLIYSTICAILIFFLIGLLLIWIPILMGLIFPVIGAVKAKDGVIWKYPFSIKFL